MTHLFVKVAVAGLVIGSIATSGQVATAQDFNGQAFSGHDFHSQPTYRHGHIDDHDYWHHDVHVPNVAQLDVHADQLAKVARHLHEDAHKLSQDYEHSQAIEYYVDQVDRLQKHMHEILHEATETGTQSTSLTEHVKGDVRQVKSLLNRLYGELHHQGVDGARTADFHAMVHMRQIVVQEAFPLIRQLEVALYGYDLGVHQRATSYRRPYGTPTWVPQRTRIFH